MPTTLSGSKRARAPIVFPIGARAQAADASARLLVGNHVRSNCQTVASVLVRATGRGRDAVFQPLDWLVSDIPQTPQAAVDAVASEDGISAALPRSIRQLAELHTSTIQKLSMRSSHSNEDVLAVGIHDPGQWRIARGEPTSYRSLCDAEQVAERTGHCVINAFPARDLAAGGQGGPVTALAQWQLLRDRTRMRVLLDLGRTTRLTYLPAGDGNQPAERVLSFDVGPGTVLLDALARHFTDGQVNYDPGGRLAVQGRKIPKLIEHWLRDPYFQKPLPRWYANGVQPGEELEQTVRMAVGSDWSIRDLLCTATHLIADCVKLAFDQHLPSRPAIDEILITGGGSQNGLLIKEITERLSGITLTRIGKLGLTDELLNATCAAALALLHIDQVPASHPAITGSEGPRVWAD